MTTFDVSVAQCDEYNSCTKARQLQCVHQPMQLQEAGLPLLPDAPVLALSCVWGSLGCCLVQPTEGLAADWHSDTVKPRGWMSQGIPMLPRWVLLVADAAAACSSLSQHSQLTAPQLLHLFTRQQRSQA
jgi:hypothetical protein